MKNLKSLALFLLFLTNYLSAQEKIPLLSGKVKVSVQDGTMECDLQLTDLELPKDYSIRLNKGLNILNMEVNNPDPFLVGYNRDFTDSIQSDETASYFIPSNKPGEKIYPNNIRLRYVGKFPVINDTVSTKMEKGDWRGNIAFVKGNLRLDGLQSAWYPTIYDSVNDSQYDLLKYDITIECEDCENMYFNGAKPEKGQVIQFKSDVPYEPLFFIGKYKVQESETAYLLNSNFTENELLKIDSLNKKIFSYLSDYTKIKYQTKLAWINGGTTAKGFGFAFFSNPAITVVGDPPYDLRSTLMSYSGSSNNTIVHEISHYYFGNIKKSGSYLESLIDEGFAQFLAFKYVNGNSETPVDNQEILEEIEWFEEPEFEYKPMLEFNNSGDTNDRQTYAYDYQTAILLSIEKAIGEDKMQKWIQLLLKGDIPVSDKAFFTETLKTAIHDDSKYNEVVNKYLTGEDTVQNMLTLWSN